MSWIIRFLPFIGKLGGWQLYAIVGASALAVGAWGGYWVTANVYDASYAKALANELVKQAEEIEANRKTVIEYVEIQGKERIIYRTKTKEVIKYVKQDNFIDVQCFDNTGLQHFRNAISGKTSPGSTN